MNMKKFSSLALCGLTLLGLASCATDEPSGGKIDPTKGDVYATLTLSLPTRSSTDTSGETNSDADPDYEVGFDSENFVRGVYVLLATQNTDGAWQYVGSSYQDNVMANGLNGNNVTYTLSFESSDLAKAIASAEGESTDVNVFAYCNPTDALITAMNTVKTNAAAGNLDLTEFFNNGAETLTNPNGNGAWSANSFLMTNARISAPVSIPDYSQLVKIHGNIETPLHLGTVEVERVAARFDFRDYVLNDKITGEPYAPNTYPVRIGSTDDIVAFVELQGLALVNQAKEFYYLPRVSNTGLNGGVGFELCGVETPTNYVVSPNADLKSSEQASSLSRLFFSPLYAEGQTVNPKSFNYTAFTSLTIQDNWNGPDRYKFWTYCTENTIPGVQTQHEGITTGVYFKGQILPSAEPVNLVDWDETTTQAQKVAWAMANKQPLYYFKDETNNVIYAGVRDLIQVAQQNPSSKLHEAVVEAFGDIDSPSFNLNDVSDLRQSVAGIGIYRPQGDKYYVYYFYKNRHNDNNLDTEMRAMEFATVRNNIYKLYVSNIHKFGHPGDTPDDPDPEDPDDPDETEKVYFDVEVQVLPWVVRVNSIEF